MKNNPNYRQLRSLLYSCNDLAGRHILWVNRLGDVQITRLGSESLEQWDERMVSQVQFRYELYEPGNDHVGTRAASNEAYVTALFDHLLSSWSAGTQGVLRFDNTILSQTS